MPEYREVLASFLTVLRWLKHLKATSPSDHKLQLAKIWIDATMSEQSEAPAGSPAASGMVYAIDSTCTVVRGSQGAQKHVWPRFEDGKGSKKTVRILPDWRLSELALEDVSRTPRTVVLHLGQAWLQVCVVL